ncbi:MAG: hypothetical protein COU08_04545 [Candidatus Harrisonbacteria bacterium CG10_big_fil_rev_8_21_14_0_10_42_17]|uniref:Uncharacterized protein n=1 Tax=Candidatus Harrisonbacteria bacterium CG10_big_fil_rev_8_21_14_0_10_42_17 TaxID=1974584 RepID=A0A2M6WH23_9BACT|nr:MAG: hypothetical protein COU08_04545 [Candidatus Harrisonbacteria bacterium CG10_big_fil_rev_8_21_14_0_10_42_17]
MPYGSPLILIAGIALLIQNKRNASSKATPVTKKEEIKKRKKHAAFFIIGGSIAVITNAIIFAPFADPNGFGSPKNEALAWIDGIITIMGLLATLFGSVEYFSTIRKRGKKISLSLYSL